MKRTPYFRKILALTAQSTIALSLFAPLVVMGAQQPTGGPAVVNVTDPAATPPKTTTQPPATTAGTDPKTSADPKTTNSDSAAAGDSAPQETGTGSFVPLTQLPGISDAANAATLPAFFNQIYRIAIGAGAVLAVLSIMYGGVLIMTSRGSVSSNEKAKSRIQNAILGLVLILSPTIVFGIINPSILSLDFTKDIQNLQLKQLDKIDTTDPTVGDAGPDGLSAKICSTIQQKKAITVSSGQDEATLCSAVGKGWAHYNNSCCSITDTTHACCGYDPKNDLTPAKPIADPVNETGSFTIESYEEDVNYDGATTQKCVQHYTNHYDSTAKCNAAAAAFSKKTTLHAMSNNCAVDDSKLTNKNMAPILPASAYAQLSKLPSC